MDNVARRLSIERIARQSPVLRGWSEIAALLKCSRDAARDYARKHALPVRKQRGSRESDSIVANRDEVLRWFEEFTQRTPFRTDKQADTLPDRERVMLYRLEMDRALIPLQRLKTAIAHDRISQRDALALLTRAIGIITAANLHYATGKR